MTLIERLLEWRASLVTQKDEAQEAWEDVYQGDSIANGAFVYGYEMGLDNVIEDLDRILGGLQNGGHKDV